MGESVPLRPHTLIEAARPPAPPRTAASRRTNGTPAIGGAAQNSAALSPVSELQACVWEVLTRHGTRGYDSGVTCLSPTAWFRPIPLILWGVALSPCADEPAAPKPSVTAGRSLERFHQEEKFAHGSSVRVNNPYGDARVRALKDSRIAVCRLRVEEA